MANTEDERDDRGVLDQFRWSIQALAADAGTQLSLFPNYVPVAEELAGDYDHWSEVARSFFGAGFSADQHEALSGLDRKLDAMGLGGPEFEEELWFVRAVEHRPEWEEVRSMARLALDRFGWPADPPPDGRSLYAPSGWDPA